MISTLEAHLCQPVQLLPQYLGFNFYGGTVASGWSQPGASQMPTRDTLAVINEMIESKRASNRREFYIKHLRYSLSRFAAQNPILTRITTVDIEKWLSNHRVPVTRATWLNRINTLFSYALKREYIEKNPCAKIERGTVEHRVPRILKPAEATAVYTACPQVSRAWVVLCLWCGLRPSEAARINWEDICLERKIVTVRVSKVRRFRIVPLPARAVELLRPLVKSSGQIAPSDSTRRRSIRFMREALKLERWPADIMRHTAASYHLAITGDVGKVATSLGNSPNILLTHYNGVASVDDAKEFFKVTPPPPAPVPAPNRKHEYTAIIAFYDACKSYKKTCAQFGISTGGLHYIVHHVRDALAPKIIQENVWHPSPVETVIIP